MDRWIISKTSRLKILKIGFSWAKDFRKMNSTGSIECIHALLERNQFSHIVSLYSGESPVVILDDGPGLWIPGFKSLFSHFFS